MRRRSSASLLAANLVDMAMPFLRSVALARLISQDQFGLAVSLTVVISMVEMIADFGIPISAVRRPEDVPLERTYATLHTIALVRACVIGLGLSMLAPWVASAFGAPEATWAYALLGAIAALRGLENLGIKEQMRAYVFWPEAVLIASSQVVWFVVSVAVAFTLRDFSCILWGMLGAAVTSVVLSHLLSERPWRLGWDGVAAREAIRFGLPLLPNGIASALSFGDRPLVGTLLGAAPLALYSVVMSTVTLPRSVIARLANGLLVPLFANSSEDSVDGRAHRTSLYDRWATVLAFVAFGYALALVCIGGPLLGLLFGAVYEPSRSFMSIAAISVFIRFMTMMPIAPSLAYGQTGLVLAGSVTAALAIGPAAAALLLSPNLETFLSVLTAFEFVALVWLLARSIRLHGPRPRVIWGATFLPVVVLASLAILARLRPELSNLAWIGIAGTVGLGALTAQLGMAAFQRALPLELLRRSKPAGNLPS